MSEPWLSADDIAAHRLGLLWKFQASEVDDWVRNDGVADYPRSAAPD